MKTKLQKVWAWLDGNKTIIGSTTIAILEACPIPQPVKGIIISVMALITGASVVHHYQKGYFSTKKGG
jgi:hypothetical protein